MRFYLVVLLLLCGCASAPYMDDVVDAGIAEAKAYSEMLHVKVDRGEMSREEAHYLYTRKTNEIMERADATFRARQPSRPPLFIPPTTQCRPDGFGGMRCRNF